MRRGRWSIKTQKGRLRLRPFCYERCACDSNITPHTCTFASRTISRLPQVGEVKRANQPPDGGRINPGGSPMLRASVRRLDAAEPCA